MLIGIVAAVIYLFVLGIFGRVLDSKSDDDTMAVIAAILWPLTLPIYVGGIVANVFVRS